MTVKRGIKRGEREREKECCVYEAAGSGGREGSKEGIVRESETRARPSGGQIR